VFQITSLKLFICKILLSFGIEQQQKDCEKRAKSFVHILNPITLFQQLRSTVSQLALADGCFVFQCQERKEGSRKERTKGF